VRSVSTPFHTAPGVDHEPTRRLLLLSYHFPPGTTAGALRWQKLARHAAQWGWGLDVVTLDSASLPAPDLGRLEELPPGTRVFGVPSERPLLDHLVGGCWSAVRSLRVPRFRSRGGEAADAAPPPQSSESFRRDEIRGRVRSPSEWKRAFTAWRAHAGDAHWAHRAARVARPVIDARHAAVVTCGPPHMVHEAGRRLAREFGLPLVVDMRDPWSLVERLPFILASPVWLGLSERFERRVLPKAALIVANTPPAAGRLRAAYPALAERIIAVMNGYDEEALPRPTPRTRFVIAYAGTVYLDRNPRGLFRAAARVVRALELRPAEFGVELMGHAEGFDGLSLEAMAEEEGIGAYFQQHPPASRNRALEFLGGASLLVSLPQDSDMAIPSKVFEYLQFDAWVLALASKRSATGMALQQSDADVVEPDDIAGIAEVIRTRVLQFRAGERPQAAPPGGPLSREAQAATLFDALDDVLGERAPVSVPSRIAVA
jgi:hypothetical protein